VNDLVSLGVHPVLVSLAVRHVLLGDE